MGGGGQGGRPERHLSKGRHIEVSKQFRLSFSVQKTVNGPKMYKKLFPLKFLFFLVRHC